jgi:arabinofuranosyltransferase
VKRFVDRLDGFAVEDHAGRSPRGAGIRLAGLAAVLVLAMAVTKDAWLSDDAFITLRTVDNFWNGYGLRWNPIERVQAYTHPLWMLVLAAAYGVTREPHLTTLAVSLGVTAASVWLLFRRLTPAGRAVAFLPLAGSRAFVDYSTSGLENPLSHLLLAAFWLLALADAPPSRRRLLTLTTLASLCMLTRLDLALLTAPGLLVEIVRAFRQSEGRSTAAGRPLRGSGVMAALAIGALPLLLWHAFALFYYGFLFPNTAYAKLGTSIPSAELMAQGLRYLSESFRADPLTLLTIAAAVLVGFWRSTMHSAALAFALVASLAYVVRAGGDFMSGRFLTPPFLCAVVLLATRLPARWPSVVPLALVAALAVGVVPPTSPLRMGTPFVPSGYVRAEHGIVDERGVHYPATGFVPVLRGVRFTDHMWAHEPMGVPIVWAVGAIGLLGFTAGPGLHGIDPLALADPLLARLPVAAGGTWRIGHFERTLPDGYEDTLRHCVRRVFAGGAVRPPTSSCLDFWNDVNHFRDPRLARGYHELLRITQGPLTDRARLAAIVRWNLGGSPLDAARREQLQTP